MNEDFNSSTGNLAEDMMHKVSSFRKSLFYCSNCGEKAGYFGLYDKICKKCSSEASAPSLVKRIYSNNKKSTIFLIFLAFVLVLNLTYLGDLKYLNTPRPELSEEQMQFMVSSFTSFINFIVIFFAFLFRHFIFRRRAGVLLSLATAAIFLMLMIFSDLVISETTTNPLFDIQIANIFSWLMAIITYNILRSENYTNIHKSKARVSHIDTLDDQERSESTLELPAISATRSNQEQSLKKTDKKQKKPSWTDPNDKW